MFLGVFTVGSLWVTSLCSQVCILFTRSFLFTEILYFSSTVKRTTSGRLFYLSDYGWYICDLFIFAYGGFVTQNTAEMYY